MPVSLDAESSVAPTHDAMTAVPDATVATTTPALGTIDPRAATDPRSFCSDYKKRARIDKRSATNSPGSLRRDPLDDFDDSNRGNQVVTDDGRFDARSRMVRCTLVHERIPSERKATNTPTCCPTGRGNTPCPPSTVVTVTDYKLLVESATLRMDGSVASSTLTWQLAPHRFERHNCGRRPEGLVLDGPLDGRDAGRELALMAELEAASVPAFERLARELAHHGAPAALVARARTAMRDEIRHARTLDELARQAGGRPRAITVAALPCRELGEIALENAVEGCVREAYGALIATFQAARATPPVRTAFARIARDERRHAALAEAVNTWIMNRLDDAARAAVLAARQRAMHELSASLPFQAASDELGLPGPSEARAMFDAYFTA